MKRPVISILLFFISANIFSYDFTYLESKIPPETFEACVYNYIKTVIANSEPEKYLNMTTFVWNNAEVKIFEEAMAKGRYPDPDTIIVFTYKTLVEIIIIFNEKHNFYEFKVSPGISPNENKTNDNIIKSLFQ